MAEREEKTDTRPDLTPEESFYLLALPAKIEIAMHHANEAIQSLASIAREIDYHHQKRQQSEVTKK